jgi:hypothetical protein
MQRAIILYFLIMKITFIIALVVAGICLLAFIGTYRKISRSKVCWGVVTALPSSSDSDGTTYGVTAEFRTDDGAEYIYNSSWQTSTPRYSIGDRIRIYYNPEKPGVNGILSFMSAYGFVFITFFLSMLVASTIYLHNHSHQVINWLHPQHAQTL